MWLYVPDALHYTHMVWTSGVLAYNVYSYWDFLKASYHLTTDIYCTAARALDSMADDDDWVDLDQNEIESI